MILQRAEERRRFASEPVPQMRVMHRHIGAKPHVRYFEGTEGITEVLYDTLSCRSGELRGILAMAQLLETSGMEVMDRYIAERIGAGLALKVIRSKLHETDNIWLPAFHHAVSTTPYASKVPNLRRSSRPCSKVCGKFRCRRVSRQISTLAGCDLPLTRSRRTGTLW